MNCKACGYTEKPMIPGGIAENEIGVFTYAPTPKFIEITFHGGEMYSGLSHRLFACPECGTVRIDK